MDRTGSVPLFVYCTKDLSESDLELNPRSEDQISLFLPRLGLNIILKSGFKPLISDSPEVYKGEEDFGLRIRILLRSKTKDYLYLKQEVTEFRAFSGKLLNLQVVFFCNLRREVLLSALLTAHASGSCHRVYKGWGANVSHE